MKIAITLISTILENKVNEKHLLTPSNYSKFLLAFDEFISIDGRIEHLDSNIIMKLSKMKYEK